MRERLITLGCALGALALFLAVLVGSGARGRAPARPNTEERAAHGVHAARRWLAAEQVQTLSLREGYSRLKALAGTAPAGNLLIVHLPAASRQRDAELHELDAWVRRGNTLLILAAVMDRPAWAGAAGSGAAAELAGITGSDWSVAPLAPAAAAGALRLVPQLPSGYFTAVHALRTGASTAVPSWHMHPAPQRLTLPLARAVDPAQLPADAGHDAFWVMSAGMGRILVSACAGLIDNAALSNPDNAQLLANIVAQSLAPGGAVIFDDAHQGLQAAYDPERFYRDPRLYRSVAVLVLVWFAWAAGAAPLRAPASDRVSGPAAGELARTTARLLAQATPVDAAARRLFELFFAELGQRCGRARLEADTAWALLERARTPAATLARVREWYALAHAARPVPLAALQDDLQTLRAGLMRP